MDFYELCASLDEMFPILNGHFQLNDVSNESMQEVSEKLVQLELVENIYDIIYIQLCGVIENEIVPKFWSHFNLNDETLEILRNKQSPQYIDLQHRLFEEFLMVVKEFHSYYEKLVEYLSRLQIVTKCKIDEQVTTLKQTLRESLLSQLPPHFNYIVDAFYSVSFRVFGNKWQVFDTGCDADMTAVLNEHNCKGCNMPLEKCNCQYISGIIYETNGILIDMGLLDRLAGQVLTLMIQERIKHYINDTCHGIFDRSHLLQLEKWLDNVIISWLTQIFNNGNAFIEGSSTKNVVEGFKVKLAYCLYENYAQSIIEQFFSIIIDFPDSIPAIVDLKICMEKIDLKKYLISSLKNSLESRILHPGVNTMDILTGYVAAIKAIRHLDSSGVILETVTAPIKEYLRKRSDTVRRVVTGLTEEGPTDLSEELAKGDIVCDSTTCGINAGTSNWEDWLPDPFGIDAYSNSNQPVKKNRSADIISMVVDIYGSKELFMNEYRNLMADRLLTQLDFNPEKEIRNLELLKLRFGEALLHSCEVMLKDVADSKRINSHIHSDPNYNDNKNIDISALVISAQFWPSFNKENLEIPEEIVNEFKKYTKSYEAYKGNRTLNWRNVTGRVNIVLELGDRSIEITVPPAQVIIIYHFQHKSEWTQDELSAVTKIPPSVLRRRISFWQMHGLINEISPGVFKLIEEEAHSKKLCDIQNNSLIADFDDNESAMASASDQREEELQVFWSYIVGMLTNLDSLPLERIHQMLKLFASHGVGIEFSQNELKDFLQRKVREHKLLFSGGVYQLTK